MKVGIPKEIKDNESRVGSGFSDDEYVKAEAVMLPTIEETYDVADMIVKVKEPIGEEYALVKPGNSSSLTSTSPATANTPTR